ncbi:hypothetical protein DL769_009245 [Monosporascus sp. CRB-8-3]|nr:hypothetical protein DL769_009245 [Monosporascus sp. CRB-8-3]
MLNLLPSSVPPLARFIVVASCLVPAVHGAVADVFQVKGGNTRGGCDGKNIDGWFTDVKTLIDSASAGVAATDEDSRKYLKTFFSIGPNDDATQAGDPIRRVASVVDAKNPPPGGKPWLFCNSDWLEEQQWTDVAYDPATGQRRTDGKRVRDILQMETNLSPFWSDDLREYLLADPGDYCSGSGNLGATQDQTRPSTVTLCIDNFPSNQGVTLSDIPAITAEKVSVSTLQVHSLTLFHEMFHLALGTAATPDAGYNLNSVVRYATKKAVTNPESFTFYALAYYLGQNTQYTFANSKSANKPALTPKRRSPYRSERDFLIAFQPERRELTHIFWAA